MISIIDFSKEPRAIREAKDEGRQEEQILALQRQRSLILRQLTKRFGELDATTTQQVTLLSSDQLDALGEALLDFNAETELVTRLQDHPA